MSALSDTITGLAREYPHLSELAITRICRKAWPHLQRCEVVSTLEKHGISLPATNPGDEYTRASIQADAAAGMSDEMIAAKFGKSVGDVRFDGGLPSATPAPKEAEDVETAIGEIPRTMRKDNLANSITAPDLARLRAQGLSWKDVALKLEISTASLYRLLKDYNLPREPATCRKWLDGEQAPAVTANPAVRADQAADDSLPPRIVRPKPAAVRLQPAAQQKPCSPPLLTVSKRAWPGETARRRLQTLVAALDDAEVYDVELCVREVQA